MQVLNVLKGKKVVINPKKLLWLENYLIFEPVYNFIILPFNVIVNTHFKSAQIMFSFICQYLQSGFSNL